MLNIVAAFAANSWNENFTSELVKHKIIPAHTSSPNQSDGQLQTAAHIFNRHPQLTNPNAVEPLGLSAQFDFLLKLAEIDYTFWGVQNI